MTKYNPIQYIEVRTYADEKKTTVYIRRDIRTREYTIKHSLGRMHRTLNKALQENKLRVGQVNIWRGGDIEVLYYPVPEQVSYPVVTVTREDLEYHGYDTSNVTHEDMESIAEDMQDGFSHLGVYYDLLENSANGHKIPRPNKSEYDED